MSNEEPEEITVQFLQDYRGELTNEDYFLKGSFAVFPAEQAQRLIDAGRARKARARKDRGDD